MSDAVVRVFISYSRTDTDFVDTLQADLQARNFDVWVDRRKLEGDRDWAEMIQSAIDRCDVLAVVLSPNSLESEWVRKEYSYAQDNHKTVIPLRYRSTPRIPIRLHELQWVSFEENYDQGMKDLLIALTPITALPPPPNISQPPASAANTDDQPDMVIIRPTPPRPNPNLEALYRAGLEASVDGDLERAAVLWGQILEQDPTFQNGTLKTQFEALNKNLRPLRIERLRDRAKRAATDEDWRQAAGAWRALLELVPQDPQAQQELPNVLRQRAIKARRDGFWGEEIGAWEALLQLQPNNQEAKELIPIAEQNQQWEYKYASAQQFAADGKTGPAKAELELLWANAPYYGDPTNLAAIVGISVPPDYATVKATREREAAERQRLLNEQLAAQRAAIEAQNQKAQRIVTLRDQAEASHIHGAWLDEITAWKELLQLQPDDIQALERLPVAENNQQYAATYSDIQRKVNSGLTYSPKTALQSLWEAAPYYGDPGGIAAKLGLTVPPSYEELKRTNPEQIVANAQRMQTRQKESEQQAIREAKAAEERAAYKKSHTARQYFLKYGVGGSSISVFIGTLMILIGIGGIVAAYTQSWIYALATAGSVGIIAYASALRKVHAVGIMLLAILLSGTAVYGLSFLLAPLHYDHIEIDQIWLLGGRNFGLGEQRDLGTLVGSIAGFLSGAAFASIISYSKGDDDWNSNFFIFTLVGLFFALFGWLLIALFGTIFNGGFGFGNGWQLTLLVGLPLAMIAGMGIAGAIAIGRKKVQD